MEEETHTINLPRLDLIADILGASSINLASNAESSSENLKDSSFQLLSQGASAHDTSDLNDLIERDGLGVLDVLLLLAVTGGLLEGLDDQRRGGGHDGDLGLSVLDGESHGDAETFLLRGMAVSDLDCID